MPALPSENPPGRRRSLAVVDGEDSDGPHAGVDAVREAGGSEGTVELGEVALARECGGDVMCAAARRRQEGDHHREHDQPRHGHCCSSGSPATSVRVCVCVCVSWGRVVRLSFPLSPVPIAWSLPMSQHGLSSELDLQARHGGAPESMRSALEQAVSLCRSEHDSCTFREPGLKRQPDHSPHLWFVVFINKKYGFGYITYSTVAVQYDC